MKFGHTLKKAQDMAQQKAQMYNDYWVNYKQLKKQIKNICRAKAAECSASEGASSEDQAPEGRVAPKIGALRTVHAHTLYLHRTPSGLPAPPSTPHVAHCVPYPSSDQLFRNDRAR